MHEEKINEVIMNFSNLKEIFISMGVKIEK